MSRPELSVTSSKDIEKSCVDENSEKRGDDSSDKSPKYLNNDRSSPEPCVRDRVLKEVGFTSTAFIGPAFPPEVPKAKPDFKDSLSEFYKEIEKIDTLDGANNNPGKHDVQPLKPSETSTRKQIVPAENMVTRDNTEETDGYQKNSRQTHKSWTHWYHNEPYHLNRNTPEINCDRSVSNQSQGHYPHPQNRPTQPRFHRPPFPTQSHQSAFPNPQHLPQHINLPMNSSGMANQYHNESNFPAFFCFPSPNPCSHPSQGFYGNFPQHFGRGDHSCNYDTNSDNAVVGWSRDRREDWSWNDEDYDRPQKFDSENESWEQQHHHKPRDGTHTYHSASVLILMRGLPGSGKTTLARELLSTGPSGVILSTDDYFAYKDGYRYDPGLLGAAHEWNQSRAKDALHDGRSPVIIDNTNLQAWEMKPYVRMALERGYKVDFCEPDTRWKFDPYELEKRNKHSVPQDKIAQMMDRFSFPISIDIVMSSQEPPHVNQRRQPEQPQMTSNKLLFH
ncbi:NEDD4-binding protein 2-like 2 [Melanotaenia boesemani]|uniref:NEDD4-binding protein 2-like 2 n=1 Tax=Melanotaenia boesemani TaxID=1250792 RepID=UPI001C042EC2|nr:NEDD4-binding protein 2-like 2 [Melanotaenia boesemani]